MDVEIVENTEHKRFEGYLDDELVGIVEYIPLPGKVIATHTEVFEQYEGRGIASKLVSGMVRRLRDEGRLLQPMCSYVGAYLQRHPEDTDVVDPSTPS